MNFKTTINRDGYSLVTPTGGLKDVALFRHCTEGQPCCLKERVIDGDVGELLLAHGVHVINMVGDREARHRNHSGHNYIDDICDICGHSMKYAQENDIKCFVNKLVGKTGLHRHLKDWQKGGQK